MNQQRVLPPEQPQVDYVDSDEEKDNVDDLGIREYQGDSLDDDDEEEDEAADEMMSVEDNEGEQDYNDDDEL